MKIQISKFLPLVVLMSVFSFFACDKDDDSNDDNVTGDVSVVVRTNMQRGTWRITEFIDSGSNETNHYVGYVFTFNSNSTLEAFDGTETFAGTWSVIKDGSDDDDASDYDFVIAFSAANELQELNDDWDIVSQSETQLVLIDISGGNGETDYLTFERI
tara:strand:- start:684 stop:1157 length:474 start_codon:yes stop_codon:yes gene_type:complete